MINKFQQGGAAQGGSILQQIQQLPQEQQQQIMQAFTQWAQQKGVDIQQLQQNPQALEQALGQFMQEMQAQQTQAAKHGAKLRFIKNLKHQCAEDEELKYFAKGGHIGCNCVKKEQKGGKTEPKKSALQQFKDKKAQKPLNRTKAEQDSINKKSEEDYFKGVADHTKPGQKIQLKKDKCGGKMKKHQIGGTLETLRQSLGLEKKNEVIKAQEGSKIFPFNPIQKTKFQLPHANDVISAVPNVEVNGIDRRWRFDTRETNHGNGYGVKSQTFFDYYNGGNRYLGDSAPIRGGRTIYKSPKGNDTLYWNQPSKWIDFQNGYMPVGGNQPGAKANFFKNLKRPLVKEQEGGTIDEPSGKFNNALFNLGIGATDPGIFTSLLPKD